MIKSQRFIKIITEKGYTLQFKPGYVEETEVIVTSYENGKSYNFKIPLDQVYKTDAYELAMYVENKFEVFRKQDEVGEFDMRKAINKFFRKEGRTEIDESPRQVINDLRVEHTPEQVIEKITSFIESIDKH